MIDNSALTLLWIANIQYIAVIISKVVVYPRALETQEGTDRVSYKRSND
jgi:hypothetical protein